MSVYMLISNGRELIQTLIATSMRSKGLIDEIDRLHKQWIGLINTWNDPYAQALVLNECDEGPWIQPQYVYINEEIMAQIFDEVLGGSTLSNLYSFIQRNMRGKLNKEAIINKIEESSFYKDYRQKVLTSIQTKKDSLALCNKKAAEVIMTEEERMFSKVLNFDNYYSYSDDINVWRNGSARHAEVIKIVKETLEEKPHLKKVVEVVAKHYNLSFKFFVEQ